MPPKPRSENDAAADGGAGPPGAGEAETGGGDPAMDAARRRELAWSEYRLSGATAWATYQQALHDIGVDAWNQRQAWLVGRSQPDDAAPADVLAEDRARQAYERELQADASRRHLDAQHDLAVSMVDARHRLQSDLADLEPVADQVAWRGLGGFAVGAADEGIVRPEDRFGDPASWQVRPGAWVGAWR